MIIKLVFGHWEREGGFRVTCEQSTRLSLGDFHSGSTFSGEISLDPDEAEELQEAMDAGYEPVFWLKSATEVM